MRSILIRYISIRTVLAFSLLITSCSDKYDSLVALVPSPSLSFDRDTIVLREKDYLRIVRSLDPVLRLYSTPVLPQMNIMYNEASGKIHFSYRGSILEDGKPIIVAGDNTSVFCSCDTTGMFKVDFYLTDHFGRTDSRTLVVDCLANDRPVAALSVALADSSQPDNWRYRLDASATIKKLGLISDWYFNVDQAIMRSTVPVIDYVFHQRGFHTVRVYAVDDLGVHSDTITQKVTIP